MKKLLLLLIALLFLVGCANDMNPVVPPEPETPNEDEDFYEWLPHRVPCEETEQ